MNLSIIIPNGLVVTVYGSGYAPERRGTEGQIPAARPSERRRESPLGSLPPGREGAW